MDVISGEGPATTIKEKPSRFSRYRRWAVTMEPKNDASLARPMRALRHAQSMGVVAVLELNSALLDRYDGELPNFWPTSRWPWIRDIETKAPEILDELKRYMAGSPLPHTAEYAGLDPESELAQSALPLDAGVWRSVGLCVNGRLIPEAAAHFPVTVSAFASVRGITNMGFSVLEPGSHIAAHNDPNRGALRFQLPVMVPGAPGDCRIRVEDEVRRWEAGKAIVFDLNKEHEVWNLAAGVRVVVLAEIPLPLPIRFSLLNRFAQHCYRWHPSFRGMPGRSSELARRHDAHHAVI